eukprot:TRINITY_DN3063_c0_g1_i1.p1 TRINITY_DN3063_c0_g1~~TRINITY_DN3063_c0_g1_i1.p1  ORF type:complete len:234 (+),score=72.91 TRINITY_DN3063_c0_g1_i1:45-746(+)
MSNPIHTKGQSNVSFSGKGDTDCPGFYCKADGSQLGVIVIQEWWGMNAHITTVVEEFAAAGFCALVPDLYRGEVATDNEHAGHLMGGLDWAGAVADIAGAAKYLRDEQGCTKVGVVGFCMGGALALAAAALTGKPLIDAASCFYGIPSAELADPAKIKIPVQCHFGNEDTLAGFSDPAAANALEEKLKAGGVTHEMHRYPAQHAFANRASERYHEESANKALAATYAFFKANM